MSDKLRIIVIGGVAAGPKTAARARRMAPEAEITLIDRGTMLSYGSCGLPFYLDGTVKNLKDLVSTSYGVTRDEEYFLREKGINVLTRTEVQAINRDTKSIQVRNLDSGDTYTLPYDKLVLATGATPVIPPFEGLELKGVFRLYHPDDARAIAEKIDEIEEVVLVGGGFIGMELAGALNNRHLFVSVVEMQEQTLAGVLDPDLEAVLRNRLQAKGIEFYLKEKVLRFEGDERGNLREVITDKRTIETDACIIATGVRPNVELARAAGLTIGPTGAIAVNEYLQTSDPDIYAVGDCVENTHLISGRKIYLPLASTANRQGRVAGDNVTGHKSRFKGVLATAVLQVTDWNIGRTGLGEQEAKDLGYEVVSAITPAHDRTHFHPEHGLVILKVIMDRRSRKLLGVQAIGPGEVDKRIDVAATALNFGATIDDLADLDLGYAPPYSTSIDPLQHTANSLRNKLAGLARAITPLELKAKIDRGDDFLLLDVRTEREFQQKRFRGAKKVLSVSLDKLREHLFEIPRDQEIVLMCESGVRSYEALRTLEGAGFKNVGYLEGGFQTWPYGPSGLMS
ncbi:MAG: FAD-dependent oxidoreductase [Peptococcaceae bacterium]|nr:FAD-dependent oxidoreductase [Peptococcaceae bacterium]